MTLREAPGGFIHSDQPVTAPANSHQPGAGLGDRVAGGVGIFVGRGETAAPAVVSPTVEVPGRGERIDAAGPGKHGPAVTPAILEHVADSVSDLARRFHDFGVVAVVEDGAATVPLLVEGPGYADLPALDTAGELRVVGGFADEMDVVALDRELTDPKPGFVAAADEGSAQDRAQLEAAQLG